MRGVGYVLLIALPLSICAGCDKDEALSGSNDNRVSFDVRVAGMDGQVQTRGTLKNNTSSSQTFDTNDSFKLISWKGSVPFYPATTPGGSAEIKYDKSNSRWQPADSPQWPASGNVTFYAASNLPSSGASWTSSSAASATLSYAVPDYASAQTDILMGCYSGTGNGGVVEFTFYHPLTALMFKKGTFENASSTIDFKKITVSGVYASGTATQAVSGGGSVFSWTPGGSTKTVQLLPSGATYINVTSDVIGEPFLLIPQTLSSSASVTITVEAKIDGTTDVTFAKTLSSGEWKAGYINTYTLGFTFGTGYLASGNSGQDGGQL